MCGRFSIAKPKEKITQRYGIPMEHEWKVRYNIAPTQYVPIITNERKDSFSLFKWGLIPNWSLDAKGGPNLINAKSETIFSKAPFKHAIKSQRCIIPADGFFEWKKVGKNKVPYRITLANDDLFSIAGIWDRWENPEGQIVNTFSIITTEANHLVANVHDRMPVILSKDTEREWLNDHLTTTDIEMLMQPYDPVKMSYYQAHRIVNSPEYDHPECIQVAPKIYPGETFSLFD